LPIFADPQGRNPKVNRPFVVVTSDADLAAGCPRIQLIGITTALHESPADHYVVLPFGPHAKTRLKVPSGALCTWLIEVDRESVRISDGYVGPAHVQQI